MSDDKGLVVSNSQLIAPVASLEELKQRYELQNEFIKSVLKEGVDFGVIPGTDSKPVLLKPGAEKITTLYGVQTEFVLDKEIEDWTGADHLGEAFFMYRYTVNLKKGDVIVANSQGSANSWEKKYRYRTSEIKCPVCEEEGTIIKGKEEYGGGWLCWAKKGGCGTKYDDMDETIVDQPRGTVPNPNPADVVNTLQKMAQKRALVAAALIVGNVSDHFTQDLEDMDFGVVVDVKVVDVDPDPESEPEEPKKEKLKRKPAPKPEETSVKKGSIPLTAPTHKSDWDPISDFTAAHPDLSGADVNQIRKENNQDALLVYKYLKDNYA